MFETNHGVMLTLALQNIENYLKDRYCDEESSYAFNETEIQKLKELFDEYQYEGCINSPSVLQNKQILDEGKRITVHAFLYVIAQKLFNNIEITENEQKVFNDIIKNNS